MTKLTEQNKIKQPTCDVRNANEFGDNDEKKEDKKIRERWGKGK